MKLAISQVLLGLFLLATLGSCRSEIDGRLTCISTNDCPPDCTCEAVPGVGGVCETRSEVGCGGTCDRETSCPAGTSCRSENPQGGGSYSCLPPRTSGGCASPSGALMVTLTWTGGGDLDLGMQTPDGSVAPGFEGEPGADPTCTHGGNDPGTLGQETMICPSPLVTGGYDVHVDSEADEEIMFTLTITVGGQNVTSLESGIPPRQSGMSPIMTSIPAQSFQEWVAEFCVQ